MMRSVKSLLLAACFALVSPSVMAAEPTIASVKKLMEIQDIDAMIEESVNGLTQSILDNNVNYQTLLASLDSEQKTAVQKVTANYVEQMKNTIYSPEQIQKIKKAMIVGTAKVFTQEEVDAMIAFYDSPLGRSINRKTPQYLQASLEPVTDTLQHNLQSFTKKYQPQFERDISRIICNQDKCPSESK